MAGVPNAATSAAVKSVCNAVGTAVASAFPVGVPVLAVRRRASLVNRAPAFPPVQAWLASPAVPEVPLAVTGAAPLETADNARPRPVVLATARPRTASELIVAFPKGAPRIPQPFLD